MIRYVASSVMPVPRAALAAWHARPGALERLVPGWSGVEVERSVEAMHDGATAKLRVPIGAGLRSVIEAIHEDVRPGEGFVDRMVHGPFAAWRHAHRFEDGPTPGTSRLRDAIDYRLPLGALGHLGAGVARRRIDAMFRWRHERTRRDLRRHAELAGPPLVVAVSGASGFVGTALAAFLTTGGHTVRRIVRTRRRPDDILWDIERGSIEGDRLDGVDAVIHLAGESIAQRWNAERRRRIRDSRVQGTALLARALAERGRRPSVLVSASAIGYYGASGESPVDEDAGPGTGFLAEVCQAWEHAAEPARAAGIRVVHPRIGMVLGGAGGALAAMRTPFQCGLGGPVGSGRQGVSWIALDDLLASLLWAVRCPACVGPFNAVAPAALAQRDLATTLGAVLRRPALAPMPAAAVGLMFGDMGRELLLAGAFVRPARLEAMGFRWEHRDLASALAWELGRAELPAVEERSGTPGAST